MATIEGIVNQALDIVGYPSHIGNIYEGSKASIIALNLWGTTRDALFTAAQPIWAKRDLRLVLLKSAPNINNGWADYSSGLWDSSYPTLPWLYEYEYPTDCLLPLQIKVQTNFVPVYRPRPRSYRVSFDSQKVILTNTPDAILSYIAAVLDPDDWYDDFAEAMVEAVAKKMQIELGKSPPPRAQQQEDDRGNAAG